MNIVWMVVALIGVIIGLIATLEMRRQYILATRQRVALNTLLELHVALFDQVAYSSWYDAIRQIEAITTYAANEASLFLVPNSSFLYPNTGELKHLLDRAVEGFLDKDPDLEEIEEVIDIAKRLRGEKLRIVSSSAFASLLERRSYLFSDSAKRNIA